MKDPGVNMDQLTTPHQTSAGAGLGFVVPKLGAALSGTETQTPLPGEGSVIPPLVISRFTQAFALSQAPTWKKKVVGLVTYVEVMEDRWY